MNRWKIWLLTLFVLPLSLSAQVFYNKGAMSVAGSVAKTALYIKGNMVVDGTECAIANTGKTVLTGDFVNNVSLDNVFTNNSTGTFEFKGTTTQHIRGSADKANHYIEFPYKVTVKNVNTVVLDPLMGATVTTMSLNGGRFIIDSKVSGDKTDIAHLLVKDTIYCVRENVVDTRDIEGIVQVNLAMGDNALKPDRGHLVGFSSPFNTMYADYFFFNFMALPTSESFFKGNKDLWNLDPKLEMPAGKGYVIGQGIVPHVSPHNAPGGYYYTHKNTAYNNADYADVAKERFVFARLFAPTSLTQFVRYDSSIPDSKKYEGERLNTKDVFVPIEKGFNYLGNPFTVPLNMASFLSNPVSTTWLETAAGESIEPTLYILTPRSTGAYNNGLFSFNTNYQVIQHVGSTADAKMIAPMQMFAIKKNTTVANKFRLNAAHRKHGKTQFLRSDDAEDAVVDELLIETKDSETEGYDRLCVVFRNTATLKGDDMYDAEKLFNTTGGVNQIYTRSSDNIRLTTNVIPPTTEKLQMYFDPSDTEQQVTLAADRISSLQSVRSVILEDTKTGEKTDLILKPSYTFVSSPTDHNERFILHFRTTPTGIDEIESSAMPLSASYTNGVINLYGLRDADLGHTASVYSMQGQLLYQQKITENPSCRLYKSLTTGIYIIKVDGNSDVIKLPVK